MEKYQTKELANKLGSTLLENKGFSDNLAIALCAYFERHMDRPDDDPETENGWGEWVENKCDEFLEILAKEVNE